ncbi:MMPL family transporter [Duganella sp. FT92W]|uniref:MMPL family transporter n=1 Tax=Pseudoduganella rivuli TaxID=2666085 RepID=A0A7X2LS03_9BURK|nr:MMPL family transporter [Pseudoduganella rivuli]MRV70457.1 MMPL family transporter [Pseudoduganella rivuli]
MHADSSLAQQPVVRDLASFDPRSGNAVERLLFNNRLAVLILCMAATLLLGWQATRIELNASFENMIPKQHPYIVNFLQNKSELTGSGNVVRVAVEQRSGTIIDAGYLATLQKISDELYLLPGVDRPRMKSLWTASTRWISVTEEGLEGGAVIPPDYDGGRASLDSVQANIARSGELGQLVSPNWRSSVVTVPLLTADADGKPINYAALSAQIEQIRSKYQSAQIVIHVTGFAKVVGDLIEGVRQILLFFAAAIVIAAAMLYWFTRCVRSTALVLVCSLVAVIWQLGLLPALGYALDPYSVLVPFLVFAIGMSHGAQKMNGIMQDIARGTHKLVAARYTFRRLFLAGVTALLCDAVGFAVLMMIRIQVIQDLAIVASIGVAVLIFTNLMLLPILLSYTGVSARAAARTLEAEQQEQQAAGGGKHPAWEFLDLFTRRKWAALTIIACALVSLAGYAASLHLKIGDLDAGAPELRADSRYNRDAAFMSANYGASSDVFVVIVKTPPGRCAGYDAQSRMDALEWQLRQVPGVESTNSLSTLTRKVMVLMNEGLAKWYELLPNQSMLNSVTNQVPPELFNVDCNTLSLLVYLADHKADTLSRVSAEVAAFARENNTPEAQFLLAAGSAGIEAATNSVVAEASRQMLFWVYGAVVLLCLVTFRSWRAVICAVVPLVMTSILCEALMVALGIGVKVATLPVIALGVGIGVDYALYVMSIMLAQMREGKSLSEAYYRALLFTGKVVMLTGFTLAIGVATWAWSPIKFQADMGVLLAFMFIWNMLGALILLPALSYFLLRPQAAGAASAPAVAGTAAAPAIPEAHA